MPCRSLAVPRICRTESNLSRPRHSAAWERHGTCEIASVILRRHVGDLPAFREWQGRGRGTAWERHGMYELTFNAAGERHGMCELAFNVPPRVTVKLLHSAHTGHTWRLFPYTS
jgi:hypothetical protein